MRLSQSLERFLQFNLIQACQPQVHSIDLSQMPYTNSNSSRIKNNPSRQLKLAPLKRSQNRPEISSGGIIEMPEPKDDTRQKMSLIGQKLQKSLGSGFKPECIHRVRHLDFFFFFNSCL